MMGGALGMHMGASTTSMRPTPPGCEATSCWLRRDPVAYCAIRDIACCNSLDASHLSMLCNPVRSIHTYSADALWLKGQ